MSNANEILRGSDRSDALLGSGAQRRPSHHGQSCASCGSPGGPGHVLKACIACHKVLYCNVACQKLHWKEHKEECYAFREQKKEEWRQISRGVYWTGAYVMNELSTKLGAKFSYPPRPIQPETCSNRMPLK
ncbi:hypothetical protein FRB95_002433 [Tulasnella sp. JGI-2019a]|nr:hypothetical protein FRB95_002433 [Tulasnella sp. JGI-2019a]